jgi:hypothetical protein
VTAVPVPTRAEVDALLDRPLDDDEWAGCEAIIVREAAHGIEVTDRYLAWAVEQAREGA